MGCGSSRAVDETIKSKSGQVTKPKMTLKAKKTQSSAKARSLMNVIYKNVNQFALDLNKYYKNQIPPQNCKEFSDDFFPTNNNSVFGRDSKGDFTDPNEERRKGYLADFIKEDDNIIWLRAKDIFPGGKFNIFEGNIEFSDIKQGNIGDCYFLSAIAALTEYPQLVAQVFRTLEVPSNGCYEIAMRINGEWRVVILDDYFPCDKETREPIFCKPNNNEIWTMLLEKAWAKINKGYLNIVSGWATEVLGVLTSFPLEYVTHSEYSSEEKKNELWNKIKEADMNNFVMAASTSHSSSVEKYGLVPGHAFTLISAVEKIVRSENVRLLKIRNPWGNKEWDGDWSDKSPKWTPDAISTFKFDTKAADDGIFWISYKDFLVFFESTEICKVSSPDASISIKIPKNRVESFNVYELQLERDTEIDVAIVKKFFRFNRSIGPDDEQLANIIVVKKDGNSLIFKGSACDGCNNPNLSLKLEAGNYLIYFNVNYTSGKFDKKRKYILYVSCDEYFKLFDRGTDDDLTLLKEIIISQVKSNAKYTEDTKTPYTQICETVFENTSFGFLYIWNKTGGSYSIEGKEALQEMFLMTPYSGSVVIPSGSDYILIGNRKEQFSSVSFFIDYANNSSASSDNSECLRSKQTLDKFLIEKTAEVGTCYDVVYNQIDVEFSKFVKKDDMSQVLKESLVKQFSQEMSELEKLPPLNDGATLFFNRVEYSDGSYHLGEWRKDDPHVRHGRGKAVFAGGDYFFGYYVNDVENGGPCKQLSAGELYEDFMYKDGNIIGEGFVTYSDGTREKLRYFEDGSCEVIE